MNKIIPWQVNVIKRVDCWITIYADSKEEAEKEAAGKPNIINVVTGHTVRGDMKLGEVNLTIED